MKRFLFVCAGLTAALCLLGIGKYSVSQPQPVFTISTMPSVSHTDISPETTASFSETSSMKGLPYRIPDTPLVVHTLGDYEGPFVEDGTDTEMRGVCLILENTSDSLIEHARIQILQNRKTLIFEVSYLPPMAQVMIIEKNKTLFSTEGVDSCRCEYLTFRQTAVNDDRVYVSGDGECSMIVTNLTAEPLSRVRIFYKQYFPDSLLYFGGITYNVDVMDLLPGESRRITPYHYLTDQGRIVAVTVQ